MEETVLFQVSTSNAVVDAHAIPTDVQGEAAVRLSPEGNVVAPLERTFATSDVLAQASERAENTFRAHRCQWLLLGQVLACDLHRGGSRE